MARRTKTATRERMKVRYYERESGFLGLIRMIYIIKLIHNLNSNLSFGLKMNNNNNGTDLNHYL